MEYMEGGSLEQKLNQNFMESGKRMLPVDDAVEIIQQISYALGDLHSEHFVHRDVKPGNILVKRHLNKDLIKLGDFGCAAFLRNDRARQTAGTIPYLAPGVVMGGNYQPQSDIYSLGVVFYELLTGELPFRFFDIAQFQKQIAHGL